MADESVAVLERGSKGEEEAARRGDTQAPASAPPPAPPPAGSPELLALGNFLAKQGAIGQTARSQADAMRPKIASVVEQGNALATQAAATVPQPTPTPPPPSRELHGFLAPTATESPEASVGKFLTAIGVFAGGALGLSKGNARGSLAALTGALQGWHDGDKEKSDREFADWKAKTDTLLTDFKTRSEAWERWFKASKLSLDQRVKGLELEMRADGMELDAAKLEAEGPKYLFEVVDGWHKEAGRVALEKEKIEAARDRAKATDEFHQQTLALKEREVAAKEKEAASTGYTDATLNDLATRLNNGEKITELVRGFGKKASSAAIEIQNRAQAQQAAAGGEAGSLSARRKIYESNAGALNKLAKEEADFLSFLSSFEKAVGNARQLSATAERTGIPLWNAVQLKSQVASGNTAAKNWSAQLEILANELARVTSRQRTATVESRNAARELLDRAQTKEQFESLVTNVLERDAQYAKEGFAEQKAILTNALRTNAWAPSPPAYPVDAPGKGEATVEYVRDKSGRIVPKVGP